MFSQELIEKAEEQPNIAIGVLGSIVVVILTVFFKILFGGKKPAVCAQYLLYTVSNKLLQTYPGPIYTARLNGLRSHSLPVNFEGQCSGDTD